MAEKEPQDPGPRDAGLREVVVELRDFADEWQRTRYTPRPGAADQTLPEVRALHERATDLEEGVRLLALRVALAASDPVPDQGEWQPGDPVYQPEPPATEGPQGGPCPRCGARWSAVDVTACPVCPTREAEGGASDG